MAIDRGCRLIMIKRHLLGRSLPVLRSQMAIYFADQDAPVAVPDPFRNCEDVHAAHDAVTDESMPAIVEAEIWKTGLCSHQFQGFANRADAAFLASSRE